jgi:deoxyhypusine synthase
MREAGLIAEYGFDLDLHAEVFESCAYHRWGLFDHHAHALATVILGGGVPKNYNLQPEPALGQILGLADVRGYNYDVQIVSAPVTDGSLSGCPPAEAVTWGKVDKDTYQEATESLQADYSTLMPFIVKALLVLLTAFCLIRLGRVGRGYSLSGRSCSQCSLPLPPIRSPC